MRLRWRRALQRIPQAAPEERTAETLRRIARHLEEWDAHVDGRACSEVPLTTRELLLRFPRFEQILPIYFGQDGVAVSDGMQDATTEEGVRMYIEETHPHGPWEPPSVVFECYQALALFHTEEQTDRFFRTEAMGGGAEGSDDFVEFFPRFARMCTEHLKEAPSPLWEPKRRRPSIETGQYSSRRS